MRTYQNIEAKILDLTEKTKEFAFMNRDQIFETIAQIVALGDELARFIRDIDMTIARVEREALDEAQATKMSASMVSLNIKQRTSTYKADKEWAGRQLTLLSEMRIAALAAQRNAE